MSSKTTRWSLVASALIGAGGVLWLQQAPDQGMQPQSLRQAADLKRREDQRVAETQDVVREAAGQSLARETLRQRLIIMFRLAPRLAALRTLGVAPPAAPSPPARALIDALNKQQSDPRGLLEQLAQLLTISSEEANDLMEWAFVHSNFCRLAPLVGQALIRVEGKDRDDVLRRFAREVGLRFEGGDPEAAMHAVGFVMQHISDLAGTVFDPASCLDLLASVENRGMIAPEDARRLAVLRGHLIKRLFASRDHGEMQLLLAYSKQALLKPDKLLLKHIAARLRAIPADEYATGLAPAIQQALAAHQQSAHVADLVELVGLCHAIPWHEAVSAFRALCSSGAASGEHVARMRPAWISGIASRSDSEAIVGVQNYLAREYSTDRAIALYHAQRYFPTIVEAYVKHLDSPAATTLLLDALSLGATEVRGVVSAMPPEALVGADNGRTALTVASALDAQCAEDPHALLASMAMIQKLAPVVESPSALFERFPRTDSRLRSTVNRCRIAELPRFATMKQIVEEAKIAIETKQPFVPQLLDAVREAASKSAHAGRMDDMANAMLDESLPWVLVEALLDGAVAAGESAVQVVPVQHLVRRANKEASDGRWTVWSWLALVVVIELPVEKLLTVAWSAWTESPPGSDESALLRGIEEMRQLVALPK